MESKQKKDTNELKKEKQTHRRVENKFMVTKAERRERDKLEAGLTDTHDPPHIKHNQQGPTVGTGSKY